MEPVGGSIPKLKERIFFEGTTGKDTVDIAVVYICTKEDNEPEYSPFVFQELLEPVAKKLSMKPEISPENKELESTRQHTPGKPEEADARNAASQLSGRQFGILGREVSVRIVYGCV